MRFLLLPLLIVGLLALPSLAIAQNETPRLKVAILIPIEPWDRKTGLEAWRDWMQERYRFNITWIEPAVPQPNKDTPEADRKAYYANPPAIPNLEKAADADVIFTALTHVSLNEKQSVEFLKMLMTKPVVGGRRSHHALGLKLPKDVKIPGIDKPGEYGRAIFGGAYAGHHGGPLRFKDGQADHPVVKGLSELAKINLFDRGYRHKDIADDVTVLIETNAGEPQTGAHEQGDQSAVGLHGPRSKRHHEPRSRPHYADSRSLLGGECGRDQVPEITWMADHTLRRELHLSGGSNRLPPHPGSDVCSGLTRCASLGE